MQLIEITVLNLMGKEETLDINPETISRVEEKNGETKVSFTDGVVLQVLHSRSDIKKLATKVKKAAK